MPESVAPPAVGFLKVLDRGEQGLFGGLLLLNVAGRPLEFYCTAPVKASRALQILYGPTLIPYLYGEQIGKTLATKPKTAPSLVCVDAPPAMALADVFNAPVLLINTGEETSFDASQAPELTRFDLDGQPAAVAASQPGAQGVVRDFWSEHLSGFDLCEPFSRIRDAIEEAQSAAKAA